MLSDIWHGETVAPKQGILRSDHMADELRIIGVFDNEGVTVDRYTVVFDEVAHAPDLLMSLGMSADPTHPQGVASWHEFYRGYLTERNRYVGKPIEFSELPERVQEFTRARVRENGQTIAA